MTKQLTSFLSIFLLLLIAQLQAQDIHVGAKAGLNVSTITGDFGGTLNPRLAYHFGGFASIPLSDGFSLNPEVLYFSIGTTFNYSEDRFFTSDPFFTDRSFKSVNRANFLAVPVNFRYNFTSKFGMDFGPQISFLINSVGKIKQSNNLDEVPEKSVVSGNFQPDYGANLGLTFTLNNKMNIQLRYYQGLKNLNRNSPFADDLRFNIALQASVGYVIF